MRSAVRIFSFMSSFSWSNEYFFPDESSLGRLTGATEITGRALNSCQTW